MKNYVFAFIVIFLIGFFNARMSNKTHQTWKKPTPVATAQKIETINKNQNNLSAVVSLKNRETAKDAKNLTKPQELKNQVLDINQDGEIRQKALYDLTKIKTAEATKTLAEIAVEEIPMFEHLENPHSTGTYRFRNELALRITALENIDHRSINEKETKSYLNNIVRNQSNTTLKFLTQLSLDGIANHKPGKLNRVLEAMLAEKK